VITDRPPTTEHLAEDLLATRRGVALLACGEASGRLDQSLADPGATLCLVGHAVREVARGTDDGRIEQLVAAPPRWLREAAARLADRTDLDWWSRPAETAVHRQVGDGLTGLELVDHQGRARSLPEEGAAHLHTFTSSDRRDQIRRWRPDESVSIAVLDGPADWDAAGHRVPGHRAAGRDVDGVQLTLRGLLTIEPPTDGTWPWETAGMLWHVPVPGTPLPDDETGSWHHDHDWVAIGREFDPRFDEGDEIDGSELT
jgi:hypothetical protein